VDKPGPDSKIRSDTAQAIGTKVKVKTEKVGPESDIDGDDDGGDTGSEDDRGGKTLGLKSQANRIFRHAHKMLKYRLYFEDFFPIDDDRAALIYECWMAGAKVTSGVDEDKATLESMLYRLGQDKKVRPSLSLISYSDIPAFIMLFSAR
jgi:hypothetical protein